MERAELINHMEHLAEYVKYSEDAPALREIIEMLKTHEEHTETHACDSVNRQLAIDAINSHFGFNIEEEYGSAVQEVINTLPPVQPDHIADVSKKVDADLISRREALEALKALEEKPKALEDDYDFGRRQMLETCIDIIQDLQPSPSAQPERYT